MVFSVVVVVVVLVAMGASAATAASLLGDALAALGPQIAGQVVGTFVVLALLWRVQWLGPAGVTTSGSRWWWLIATVIVVCTGDCAMMALFGTLDVDLSVDRGMAPVLVHTALAGVVEELLFRGLVLYVLVAAWGGTRRGVVASVVASAALFGALHMLNLASTGVGETSLQATEAAVSALLYGALVLASGSVWPAVAVHGLVNGLVNAAAENTTGFGFAAGEHVRFILLQVPVVLVAVFVLATVPVRDLATARPVCR